MLYIKNIGNGKAYLSEGEHLAFVKSCESYILKLQNENKLIAAQPIIREGFVISKSGEEWTKTLIDPKGEVQVGYYHIRAKNMDEAVAIAKENPEFEYIPTASIEVRPIKTKEEKTDFTYPNQEH